MKKLLFISLLLCSLHIVRAQNANLGIGYGAGYYYRSLDNPKASLVMLNYSDKEWYSDKVGVASYSHGYDIEINGKSFFLLTFGVQKNKSMGGGTDPTTGQREDFELHHFNGRLGLGVKINSGSGRAAWGMAFNMGIAGYKYLITGNGSVQTEKDHWSDLSCLTYGSTMFAEYHLTRHFGVKFSWYWHWLAMQNYFQVHDWKLKYSTINAGLFFYLRKNYE